MHENRTISLEQAPSAKVQRWNVLCKGMQKYKTCPRPDWQKQHLQSPELSRCARMSKTSALDVSFSNDVEKSVNPGKYKYKLPKRHAVNWWYTCNRLALFKTPILHQTKHCTLAIQKPTEADTRRIVNIVNSPKRPRVCVCVCVCATESLENLLQAT